MNDNELNTVDDLDKLEQQRRSTLSLFIYYFSSWQLGWIATKYFSTIMPIYLYYVFGIVLLLGTLGSIWHLTNIAKITKLIKKNPEFKKVINDERECSLKNKAMAYGFTASIATSAVFLAILALIEAFSYLDTVLITANLVAHVTLVVTILIAAIAYPIMEQQE